MAGKITGKQLQAADLGVKFEVDGTEYDLVLDFNAICDLEEKYGSFQAAADALDSIGADMTKPGAMKEIRFLLWVMMKHTDPEMTELEAGRLLTMNNLQTAMNSIGKAMAAGSNTGKKA